MAALDNADLTKEQRKALEMAKLAMKFQDEPFAALESVEMTDEQRKAFVMAKALNEDPEALALSQMTEYQQEMALKAKAMYYNPFETVLTVIPVSDEYKGNILDIYHDPYKLIALAKDQVPDEYKDYANKAEMAGDYLV